MALIWLSGGDLGQLSRWSDVLHSLSHESGIVPRSSLDGAAHVTADVCVYDLGQRGDADPTHLLHAVRHHASTRFIALTARPAPLEGLTLLRGGVRGYTNRLANHKVIDRWCGRCGGNDAAQQRLGRPCTAAAPHPLSCECPRVPLGWLLSTGSGQKGPLLMQMRHACRCPASAPCGAAPRTALPFHA